MIIGIFLGISLAVFVTSISLFFLKLSGLIVPLTGAVIGTNSFTSYSLVFALISLIAIVLLINVLKHHHKFE
jgi:hypothetical protein